MRQRRRKGEEVCCCARSVTRGWMTCLLRLCAHVIPTKTLRSTFTQWSSVTKAAEKQGRTTASDNIMDRNVLVLLLSTWAIAPVPAQYVSCPDGCYCSAGTCCPDSAGGYRCCPYEHGVCCSDRESCCSRGQSCEVSNKTCVDDNYSYSYSVATVQNVPAHAVAPKHVKPSVNAEENIGCPDWKTYCGGDRTCCPDDETGRHYWCCPYAQAVCCSDHRTCCAQGHRCNANATPSCIKDDSSYSVAVVRGVHKSTAAQEIATYAKEDVFCPDFKSYCTRDQTCCPDATGVRYNCCEYSEATCCPDHKHCCPKGHRCDVSTTVKCVQHSSGYSVAVVESVKLNVTAPQHIEPFVNGACPDHTTCPGSMTCCKSTSGTYLCCPYSKATCCPFRDQCCPQGFECDAIQKRCVRKVKLLVAPMLDAVTIATAP